LPLRGQGAAGHEQVHVRGTRSGGDLRGRVFPCD
jgi:hypothetical protein